MCGRARQSLGSVSEARSFLGVPPSANVENMDKFGDDSNDNMHPGHNGTKQPYFIYRPSSLDSSAGSVKTEEVDPSDSPPPLMVACLYNDVSTGGENPTTMRTFSVMTTGTTSSSGIEWLHSRMPLICPTREACMEWLNIAKNPSTGREVIKSIRNSTSTAFVTHPVTKKINKTGVKVEEPWKRVKLDKPKSGGRVLTPLVKSVGSFFANRRLAREKREAQKRVDEMTRQVEEEEEFMRKIRARDDELKRLRSQHVLSMDDEVSEQQPSIFSPIRINPPPTTSSSSPVSIPIQSSHSMPTESQTRLSVSPLPPIRALSWKDQQVSTGNKVPLSTKVMYHFAPSGEGRCILSRDVICEFANNALPPEISLNTWSREYSLSRDGSDFHTFLNKM
ncbi:hypothetical protein TrRE_jg9248, partial [Triparma retinervis]